MTEDKPEWPRVDEDAQREAPTESDPPESESVGRTGEEQAGSEPTRASGELEEPEEERAESATAEESTESAEPGERPGERTTVLPPVPPREPAPRPQAGPQPGPQPGPRPGPRPSPRPGPPPQWRPAPQEPPEPPAERTVAGMRPVSAGSPFDEETNQHEVPQFEADRAEEDRAASDWGEEDWTEEEAEPVGESPERAMPIRLDPDGAADEEPEPTAAGKPKDKRKRRKRGLLVTGAIVLVLLLAAGALVGVPGLADRLGVPLPGSLRAADPPPDPIVAKRELASLPRNAPADPKAVQAALAQVTSNPALAKLTGVVTDPHTGKTLWQRSPDAPTGPGSTNKLLTSAAALLTFDPDKRFVTKVVQGSDPSTAVVVGGGDPTINSMPAGKDSVYWNAPRLSSLVEQVRKASGGQIKTVKIDQHRYSGQTAAKGWDPADIKAGNYTPIVPAIMNGGRADPTMAENTPRSANPGKDLLGEFAGGIGAKPAGEGEAPKQGKVLGEIRSAPLRDLVPNLLSISDNVLAETLGHEVALANGKPASFEGATAAVREVLAKHGFDVNGMQLADNSGLSTMDRLPARLIGSVVAAATGDGERAERLRPILEGLPVAGGTGTLANRYHDGPAEPGRGWVRAKTGTLTGVSTEAGYVQTKDNQLLVFTMMSNGGNLAAQKPALDAIAAKLRQCGCR